MKRTKKGRKGESVVREFLHIAMGPWAEAILLEACCKILQSLDANAMKKVKHLLA